MKIYAHRGASAEFPENTLAAFQRALELEVFGIELDVHLTRDGVPVVIHDLTVDRTTDGTGAVGDLTLDEVGELNAGAGQAVPTLAQVLELVGDRLHVDIEIKAAAAADAVLRETGERPSLRFALSSFQHDVLRHARSVNASVELWPLVDLVSDEALETARVLGSPQLAVNARFLNEDIVRHMRDLGVGCWVWTVNDPQVAVDLVSWGVTGICTDDPAGIATAFGRQGIATAKP